MSEDPCLEAPNLLHFYTIRKNIRWETTEINDTVRSHLRNIQWQRFIFDSFWNFPFEMLILSFVMVKVMLCNTFSACEHGVKCMNYDNRYISFFCSFFLICRYKNICA